jgi:hypothetical protein
MNLGKTQVTYFVQALQSTDKQEGKVKSYIVQLNCLYRCKISVSLPSHCL